MTQKLKALPAFLGKQSLVPSIHVGKLTDTERHTPHTYTHTHRYSQTKQIKSILIKGTRELSFNRMLEHILSLKVCKETEGESLTRSVLNVKLLKSILGIVDAFRTSGPEFGSHLFSSMMSCFWMFPYGTSSYSWPVHFLVLCHPPHYQNQENQ